MGCYTSKESLDTIKVFSFDGMVTTAYIIDIYDGDTFTACFQYKKQWIKIKCRSARYDSPEMKPLKTDLNRDRIKDLAIQARDRLKQLVHFMTPKTQTTNLYDYTSVKLHLGGFDKYGRVLCEIYYNNKNINDVMLKEGFGYEYNGGHKQTFLV